MSDHHNEHDDAEALDHFLAGLTGDTPRTPEQQLAAALRDAAQQEQAPADFKARTEQALRSVIAARHGDKIISLPYGPDQATTKRRWWQRVPLPSPTLSVAAVAVVALLSVLIWLIPAGDDQPTATPIRQNMVNPLPVAVGGYINGFDHGERLALDTAGMTWIAYRIIYGGAASMDALLIEIDPMLKATHAQARSLMVSVNVEAGWNDGTLPDFIAALAQRGVDAIEVIPAANLQQPNSSPFIKPSEYVRLLTDVHTTVREVSSQTILISGAPAPTGADANFADMLNDNTYYSLLAAAGIEQVVDCIGVHYKEGMVPPYAFSGDARDDYHARYLPTTLLTARQYFAEIPLCLTEVGYFAGAELTYVPSGYNWGQTITAAQQASWSADIIEVVDQLGRDHDVEVRLTVFTQLSPRLSDANAAERVKAGYALIDVTGACAACDAISKLRNDRTLMPIDERNSTPIDE